MSTALSESPAAERNGAAMDIAVSRAAQEVQAAMVIAKKFPRDEGDALARIVRSCKRKALAEAAMYAYNRGGAMVTGPSIRLAEAMAQGWGNVDYGIIELEQHNGESTCQAYAWDLETNTRSSKVFTVKHERHTKKGVKVLTDPRDIYELVANQGARRMRASILAIIPGDIQDRAVTECENTLKGKTDKPLYDRVRDMLVAFSDLGVSKEMIETRLAHNIEATAETELVTLRKIYTSIKDGMSAAADWFDGVKVKSEGRVEESPLNDIVNKPAKEDNTPPSDAAWTAYNAALAESETMLDVEAACNAHGYLADADEAEFNLLREAREHELQG